MESRKVIKATEEKPSFQPSLLKDNKTQSLKVEETDFSEVKRRLDPRESILMTDERKKKSNPNQGTREEATELWYFTHI